MTIKSLVLASACLLFGTAFAADNRSEVIEINDSLAPDHGQGNGRLQGRRRPVR